jgi:hypothetical protein
MRTSKLTSLCCVQTARSLGRTGLTVARFVLLAAPVLLCGQGLAQNEHLDANHLKLGHFQYRTLVGGKDAGKDEITIRKDPVSGNFEFANVVNGAFAQRWQATATAAFKPIAARLTFGEGSNQRTAFELSYKDGRAKGTTRDRGDKTAKRMIPFDFAVPADVVDQRIDWASVMSQDLTAGRHFEYHVFDPGTGVSRISGDVSGPEKIHVPVGTYDAMRIVYRIEKAGGNAVYQVLTNVEGPRMLLREEFPNGAVTDLLSLRE